MDPFTIALVALGVLVLLASSGVLWLLTHPQTRYLDAITGEPMGPPPPPPPPKCEIVTYVYDDGSTLSFHTFCEGVDLAELTDAYGAALKPDRVLVERRGGSHTP
jgi:hypothetical protein